VHLAVGKAHLAGRRHGAAAQAARRSRSWRAASCAALPFRSAPVEAAVAEVLATLLVSVAVSARGRSHAQLVRHHLRHLGVQALAHFGAAVVHQDGAVGVDVHQRAGLVEVLDVEADAELHRRQRQAALEHGAVGVERPRRRGGR
jgi:hypothetical protein